MTRARKKAGKAVAMRNYYASEIKSLIKSSELSDSEIAQKLHISIATLKGLEKSYISIKLTEYQIAIDRLMMLSRPHTIKN